MNLKFCTFLKSTLIFSFLLTHIKCNEVSQTVTATTVREGETMTFNCSYSSNKYVLIWYVQKPGRSIIFLLHDQYKKGDLDKEYKERITASHYPESRTFPLTIRNIQQSDMGTYYCALEHVGARSLEFQEGTRLMVEPGDSRVTSPSVFVLKPQKENALVACLVKDFYPKNLEIYMNSTKNSFSRDKIPTKLSPKGKYSAVLVASLETNDVQCQAKHQEKWVTNMETTSKLKGLNYQPTQRDDPDSRNCQKPSERTNTLSLYVIGIRVLFTKMIAFNTIVTAKLLAV